MEKGNLAAIDLGTNSCRLTVADKSGTFLYRDSIATKLGEGLYEYMRFTPAAFERGLQAFETYAGIMKKYQVETYRAIATASCRMAENGAAFVNQVKEKTGIELEVIDGREEARLNLLGASQNAAQNAEYVVVYDLGGGSTEITLAKRKPELEIIYTVSIPWGGRNAAEAYGLQEYNDENCRKLKNEIASYVTEFLKMSNLNNLRNNVSLIATSSTPLRLAAMAFGHEKYERERCDGMEITSRQLDETIEKINLMSLDQRKESKYIGENRAPIFIAACTIFQTIYNGLKFDRLTASLKGAQDGIIEELTRHG